MITTLRRISVNNVDSEKLLNLTWRCMVFTDQKGRVLGKSSSHISSFLEMEFREGDLYIHFRASKSGPGNGSCHLEVKKSEKVVLKTTGNYAVGPFNVKSEIYIPGDWEKEIPPRELLERK